MKNSQAAGWIIFVVFFIISLVLLFSASSTKEILKSTRLICFAIWWLLLGICGFVMAIMGAIAQFLQEQGMKSTSSSTSGKLEAGTEEDLEVSWEKKLDTANSFDICVLECLVFENEAFRILIGSGFWKINARYILEHCPVTVIRNIDRKKAKEVCEKLSKGFRIDIFPSIAEEEVSTSSLDGPIYCPACGKKSFPNDEKCTACKSKLPAGYYESEYECEDCGASVPEDAKYCPSCGTMLEE